jgi:hypothetical protein
MKEKIIKERGLIGTLKPDAKVQYTDELGIEWVKEEDIIWS